MPCRRTDLTSFWTCLVTALHAALAGEGSGALELITPVGSSSEALAGSTRGHSSTSASEQSRCHVIDKPALSLQLARIYVTDLLEDTGV
jgi:hypothetical protein